MRRAPQARAGKAALQLCGGRYRAGPSGSTRAAQTGARIVCRKRCRTFLPADSFRSGIARAGRCLASQAILPPLVQEAAELLAKQGSDLLAQYLIESYRPEETYGSAFGKLFARLFAQHGLILMDPLDTGLHKVAAPLFQHALAERDALNEKLLQRGKDLDRAGFDAQVKVTSRSTLLFHLAGGVRQVITASTGKFQAGEKTWARDELVHMTHTEPENFSPNALFRPVVQDYLLPTAAYIAGPAEISYFAQSEVVYRHLLGRMPVMLPRAGFTLVDAKAKKLLRRYGLSVEDAWAGSQGLRHKMERQSVPGSLPENL